jgi:UDP-N-acetylmuramoyl-tripeptide--D-alanyl-D-alanine ligase
LYILGSMRELGADSEAEHRALGARAGVSKADRLFFFGEEMEAAMEGCAAAEPGRARPFHSSNIGDLVAAVLGELEAGDLVVVKASRGLELERLTDAIAKAGWVEYQDIGGGGHAS